MADIIQQLFINPPIAVARLGGGSTPQDAYRWAEPPNPRSSGETVVMPDWSLTVEADGSVTPRMPGALRFRDGALIRPVAPFFEVWARIGAKGSEAANWRDVPLTPALLAAHGVALADVRFRITAINGKAARRTGDQSLRFGTFPPVELRANNNRSVPLLASSPPGTARPMIPPTRNIPLGSVQVIRSRPQPALGSTLWADLVNIEVLRLRFTPARGHVYGPPASAQPQQAPSGARMAPVDATRAFLDAQAGWANARFNPPDAPGDTYDGSDVADDRSLGVVDDTCEARIEVSFALPRQNARVVSATSTVFVAPPDFAPDRRPFLSLADELNDRTADSVARNAAMTGTDRDAWVEDLFERIQETVALLNVDLYRSLRAARLTGTQLGAPIPRDRMPLVSFPRVGNVEAAMGSKDALRNRLYELQAPNAPLRLPLSGHARMRHRTLADIQSLRSFVQANKGRLLELVRSPFDIRPNEDANHTTMAMPPFMRNSNAQPLTLSRWQYDLLMEWASDTEASAGPIGVGAGPALVPAVAVPARAPSEAGARRRTQVLERIRIGGPVR